MKRYCGDAAPPCAFVEATSALAGLVPGERFEAPTESAKWSEEFCSLPIQPGLPSRSAFSAQLPPPNSTPATADVAANADELAARDCHADIASYSRTASQIS